MDLLKRNRKKSIQSFLKQCTFSNENAKFLQNLVCTYTQSTNPMWIECTISQHPSRVHRILWPGQNWHCSSWFWSFDQSLADYCFHRDSSWKVSTLLMSMQEATALNHSSSGLKAQTVFFCVSFLRKLVFHQARTAVQTACLIQNQACAQPAAHPKPWREELDLTTNTWNETF